MRGGGGVQVKTAVVAGKLVIASFLALVTVLSALAVPSGPAQTGTAADASTLIGGTADIGAIKHPDGGSSEGGSPGPPGAPLPHLAAPEMKRIMVLRGYFADYTATSRFTEAEVQNIFDDQMDSLWMNTSYGNIGIDAQVSSLIALPDNREDYITGDFFRGGRVQEGHFGGDQQGAGGTRLARLGRDHGPLPHDERRGLPPRRG